MAKINQTTIRIFHFLPSNTDEELKVFITKNKPLLQNYLLVFEKISDDLRTFLETCDIDFIQNKHLKLNSSKNPPKTPIKVSTNAESSHIATPQTTTESTLKSTLLKIQDSLYNTNKDSPTISNDNLQTKCIKKLVRSGEILSNKGDIVIFNRVNSASMIKSDNNILIFGDCEGDIECNGEFLILGNITKGKIVFQGEIITPNMLKYQLNLISKDNGQLNIQNLLSL